MSPLNLHVLLWLYASPAKLEENMQGTNVNALAQAVMELAKADLIDESSETESGWRCSAKGEAYVDALCNLPFPVMRWEIP